MPSPALSAAARLTTLTNPVGTGRPASVSSPNAPTSVAGQANFADMLGQQMGLSGLSGLPGASGLSDLMANPQIAQALANAQKAVSTAASSATTALSGKGQKAVAWAKSMLGRQDWSNLCERFVEEAYGTKGVYPSAIDAAKKLVTHKGSSSLRTAPVGALLYFAADDTNDGQGHAAINLGKGEMISARPDGVKVERVDTPYNSARYLGWGPAPTKFPGRKSTTATTRPAAHGAAPRTSPLPLGEGQGEGRLPATSAARSLPTSVSFPSTPRPSPAPLIPPRLPR